jgi:hypothetical protein
MHGIARGGANLRQTHDGTVQPARLVTTLQLGLRAAAASGRASFRPSQVRLAPVAHQVGDRPQGPPVGRERIFHVGRHDRKDLAVDDAVVFQLAKLLGQHAFTDVWNFAPQFPEAADLIPQPEQNEGLPFAPDHFEGGFHRAAVQGAGFGFFSGTYHNVSIIPFPVN